MELKRYEYTSGSQSELFRFTSEGPKGSIKKLVVYSEMLEKDIYNLAFGDYDEETETIDDAIITNNGDSQKILATIASTLYMFTDTHPNVWVYATGSNSARTRLYRMGITKNLLEISPDFEVYGLQHGYWVEFEKGEDYDAFLVKRKFH
jgi:hypothetical protein